VDLYAFYVSTATGGEQTDGLQEYGYEAVGTVSQVERTCEHQPKFDGRCTVCLRDVPRLLCLALRQSSTTMQPTQ